MTSSGSGRAPPDARAGATRDDGRSRDADDASRALSVIVLAGGRALRLGGRKAERLVAGRRLVDRVVGAARALSDDVLLMPGERELSAPGATSHADWSGVCGPLAGLGAGLDAARHPWCWLLPCDLPQPSADVVDALREHIRPDTRAVLLTDASGWQPFHGLYRRDLREDLRTATARGERSLVRWLAWLSGVVAVPVDVVASRDGARHCLDDVDTPADLARAVERLGAVHRSEHDPRPRSVR